MAPRRRAAHGAADDRGGRHPHRRRHRSRDRVVSNDLWPGYKTGSGVDPALQAQFIRSRRGSRRWAWRCGRWSSSRPMMRSPAAPASRRTRRGGAGRIWTPDKDLAQSCDRRPRRAGRSPARRNSRCRRRAREVRGRSADDPRLPGAGGRFRRRLPGHPRVGARTAARLMNRTARSRTSRRRSRRPSASSRCSSRSLRRCGRMRGSLMTSKRYTGAVRRRPLPHGQSGWRRSG